MKQCRTTCILVVTMSAALVCDGFVSAEVDSSRFVVRGGWKNFGGLLASSRARSRMDCMRACLRSQECNSVNLGSVLVGRNRVECELVMTDQNSLTSITEAPGWSLTLGESGADPYLYGSLCRCVQLHNGIESGLKWKDKLCFQVKSINSILRAFTTSLTLNLRQAGRHNNFYKTAVIFFCLILSQFQVYLKPLPFTTILSLNQVKSIHFQSRCGQWTPILSS